MTEAYAWSFKGLDHETRDAARAAARRSGKSLTDWLDDMIHEQADSDLRPSPRRDEDDRAEPSARRRLLRSSRAVGRLDRERSRRGDAALLGEDAEPPRATAPAPEIERREAKAIVDDAVALFERRAAESERKTAKALGNLADLIETNHKTRARLGDDLGAVIDRLGRIEHKIARRAEEDGSRPIRDALSRLETRIDDLAKEERSVELETAIEAFDRRLAEISARLDAEAEARAHAAESARREAAEAARERLRRPAPAAGSARRPLADAVAEIAERQRVLDGGADSRPAPPLADPAARFADLASSIDALSQQIASTRFEQDSQDQRRQAAVAAQIDQLRRELDGVSRVLVDLAPRASVAAIEAALRDLAERVEAQRHYGVEDNVLAPVERLTADLHAMIRDLDPSRMVHSLFDEVKALGERLAARRAEGGADRQTLEEIASETREIRDLLKAVALRPLPFDRLEAGLAALTTRVDELGFSGGDAAGARDVGDLVAAIRSTVATETYGYFQAFERKLEEVAAKIDAVSVKSGGGKRFDEINERIEKLHKSLAARIDRSGGAGAGQLEGLVTELARKIDAAIDGKAAQPAFDELGRKIERLEERLQPKSGRAAEDKQFDELTRRIDQIHEHLAARRDDDSRRRPDAAAAQLTDLVGQLAKKMDAALERRAAADTSTGMAQFRELTQRMDRLHEQLSVRVEEETRRRVDGATAQMTDLVAQLAEKMDAALDPRAGRAAFSALEQQIGRLAERIDHTDQTIASFATLEGAIGQLMSRVEETRGSAARAAESIAREAAQEAARAAGAPTALQKALEKELVDLRQIQDETGHRTNETLSAVHETLQRVVDRLAVFEDELSDMRKARVAPPAAPAPRAEPRAEQKRRREPADVEDMLLEPGDRRPRRAARRDGEPSGSVQADFIAAARRAAQQAAVDAETAAAKGRNGRKPAAATTEREFEARAASGAAGAGVTGAVGAVLQARRRPILLGLGALVLLYGAYQIARVSLDAPAPQQSSAAVVEPGAAKLAEPAAEAPREAAAAAPSVEPAAPLAAAPTPAAPPVAKFPLTPTTPAAGVFMPPAPGKLGAGNVDSTPTGTIGAASAGAAILPSRDPLTAIRELASAGDAAAQFELGTRYADGRGLGRDAKAAFQWVQKAAEQGLAPAQYRLGSFYEKGLGVDRDYLQARGWYQRAARAGNARAMHNLAVLFAEGGDGKPDYAQAAEWFQKAAEYGVRDSQFNLAILYARGLGVPQSLEQSYVWFSAAAAQGDEDAGKKRDEVRGRLDAKSLAAAKAKAEAFQPKQQDKAANEVTPPPGGWENVKPPAKPESKPEAKPAKAKVSIR
ncbi:peptidoglycan-binding protein [Methylosinus sp. Sm6]|uniref:SEL1-like repeat protein n=1 Tax=Methylosinus sp. Sm6 TaxID=2866948 RepID=UPI001C9966D7|nr:peptidoglycan-binding protein [Methylosinus sp. Sm6]MBY6243546.1 peptidoglycan-binding protein [Methylosinus sp. Sm6]